MGKSKGFGTYLFIILLAVGLFYIAQVAKEGLTEKMDYSQFQKALTRTVW